MEKDFKSYLSIIINSDQSETDSQKTGTVQSSMEDYPRPGVPGFLHDE